MAGKNDQSNRLNYMSGFGNEFATESVQGALPVGQNAPREVPFGLYAEQLSGTAFTVPRHQNRRTWLYRIRPSVIHDEYRDAVFPQIATAGVSADLVVDPNQMRWDPIPAAPSGTDFLDGLITMAAGGDVRAGFGCAAHIYACNKDMQYRVLYNADGEMLFVPQDGGLQLDTELGRLRIQPGEIAVIPRGVKFRVRLPEGRARGYVCENYGMPFELPGLGPIGANGLANPRDFLTPTACYEDDEAEYTLIAKYSGAFFSARLNHSPLDVVAWHGNHAPYQYSLDRFNTINTVSFDHPDPSIFTVLTSVSDTPGWANVDFVIFPPRWMVAAHTFRPPYFHRNVMNEFMGLVYGQYDAKPEGFVPGGASLHNCMSPHGPDADAFGRGVSGSDEPQYLDRTLAFMFESRYVFHATKAARSAPWRQKNYQSVWQEIRRRFRPKP